ncbi:MAG: polysaccharide deacetylase family protein [Polyangia bacterium]
MLIVACGSVVPRGAFARSSQAPRNRARTGPEPVQVAVTVDDLPAHGPPLPGVSRLTVVERLLAAFAAHKLPAVHGFVNGKLVDDDPALEVVLRRWVDAGQALGNHSWSHPALNSTSLKAYLADIRRGEGIIARVAPGQAWKVFRYPFLQKGDTVQKRDGVRRFLAHEGYTVAEVTIDADDWAYNPPYVRCTARGDEASLATLRRSFIHEHVEELRRVRAITRRLAGRDVPQVLLIHAGVADADVIEALLTAFEAEGARWVPLRTALADPFYAPARHAPVKSGSSLPYVLARERRLRIDPPAWARTVDATLNATCR